MFGRSLCPPTTGQFARKNLITQQLRNKTFETCNIGRIFSYYDNVCRKCKVTFTKPILNERTISIKNQSSKGMTKPVLSCSDEVYWDDVGCFNQKIRLHGNIFSI